MRRWRVFSLASVFLSGCYILFWPFRFSRFSGRLFLNRQRVDHRSRHAADGHDQNGVPAEFPQEKQGNGKERRRDPVYRKGHRAEDVVPAKAMVRMVPAEAAISPMEAARSPLSTVNTGPALRYLEKNR